MNLKNVKHIDKFRKLPYPKNEMLIIGSGVMALLGLRKNKDIDVWATPNVIRKVSRDKNFISKRSKLDGSILYESKDGIIEFSSTFPPLNENLKQHLKRSIIVYGIHFQSPKDVIRWKKAVNRPKDKKDIKILKKYLKGKVVENYLGVLQSLT